MYLLVPENQTNKPIINQYVSKLSSSQDFVVGLVFFKTSLMGFNDRTMKHLNESFGPGCVYRCTFYSINYAIMVATYYLHFLSWVLDEP